MTAHPGNLGGKPPLGMKGPKPSKKPRKPIPRESKKRKVYNASAERKTGIEHMGRVKACPCIICGAWPAEVHHMPDPRSDMRVIPLCPRHHRREYGPEAYHYSPKAFRAAHGSDAELLARVQIMLEKGT